MGSPEPTKITTTASSTTTTSSSEYPPLQECHLFSYINNLSPIKPVKAAHVPQAQGFPGLNSPPIVFTSPCISFLKRSQYPRSSTGEISHNDGREKKSADVPAESEKSVTQLCRGLITDAHPECDIYKYTQTQPCITTGCVDEYLVDPVAQDSLNSVDLANLSSKRSNDVPESSLSAFIDSKKSIKFGDKNERGKDGGTEVEAPVVLSKPATEGLQGNLIFDVKSVKTEEEQRNGQWPINECPSIESNLSVDHAFKGQEYEDSCAQNEGGGQQKDRNCTPQSLSEPSQIVQVYEDRGENVAAISHNPVGNIILHDPEASERQCGIRRRCLQFEEVPLNFIVKSPSSLDPTDKVTNSRSPTMNAELESLESSSADLNAASSNREMVKLSQSRTNSFPPRYSGASSLPVSKPSGIGLHLNSIVKAVPITRGATAKLKLGEDYIGVQGMKSASALSCRKLENTKSCPISSNVLEKVSFIAEDGGDKSKASIAASFASSESPQTTEPTNDKRKFNDPEHADSYEFSQPSPPKKRKKTSSTNGDCRHCNCKKTKCLKLYCDCFAAGIYCAEPCACQGCYNRPEYEDTVLETRQQIESRNPLAFAPKIVQHVNEFHSREDGNCATPSSGRHKRGCNCKKSMCLKKYCECYQANVGCSSGCRCDGCKNVYGRKEDYVATEYGVNKEMVSDGAGKERFEDTFDEKLEGVATEKDFLHAELYDPHNLTPLTPSFQGSYHGSAEPTSRLVSRSYLQSPESDCTILSSYVDSTKSSRTSNSSDTLLQTNKELLNLGSYDWRLDYNNAEIMDQFSPRCAVANLCHVTPLSDPPFMAMASSISSKTRDLTNISQLQLSPGIGCVSSDSSFHRCSSPTTPMTRLEGTKSLQGLDPDNGLCDILEDDTPEILKEDSTTPIKFVKVSSPKRKRVSPPQSHLRELGSSSSGDLRSGRKFILKAVPSFPPLTPCIDSKSSTNQKASSFEEKNSSI